jgi:hypothetical protein
MVNDAERSSGLILLRVVERLQFPFLYTFLISDSGRRFSDVLLRMGERERIVLLYIVYVQWW